MQRHAPLPGSDAAQHAARHSGTQAAKRQRGSVIVYLALALVAFGVMAMAGASRYGASIMGVSSPNCATQARMMSESGMRFATAYLRQAANQAQLTTKIGELNAHGAYTVASGQSFTVSITDSGSGLVQVSATGSSCGGASFLPSTSASSSATVNVPAVGSGGGATDPYAISPLTFSAKSGVGTPGASSVNSDGTISLGNSKYASSAAVWFTGNSTACTDGRCALGNGLCAYFDFVFTSGSSGDGFVWTIMSGATNTSSSNGGDTGRGELMGYGGLGGSGLGIKPPKFGVEFDIYANTGTGSACSVGNRADDTNGYDHIAHVFWGAQTIAYNECDATYDDNVHGAGAGTSSEPMNAKNTNNSGNGSDGYYYRSNSNTWLKNGGTFNYRYELDRATTPDGAGNYCYRMRSWVKKPGDSIPAGLSNCNATYSGAPDLTSTFSLSAAMHQKLDTIFFGWTEGTGGATQLATVSNFTLAFKDAPVVPIVPQDYISGWSFYETSGTTVHDGNNTNNNDGSISGTGTWIIPGVECPVSGATCPNSAAMRFSSDAGRVVVPDSNSLDVRTSGTIAAWVNIQNYKDYAGIVHKGQKKNFSDEAYSLQFDTGRKVSMNLKAGATLPTVTSVTTLTNDNQWYHVAATWDDYYLKIYINGVLDKQVPNTGGIDAAKTKGKLILGAQITEYDSTYGYYGFDGIIDQIYLYARALSATEIANMALGHP